jgi:hypothetical protein
MYINYFRKYLFPNKGGYHCVSHRGKLISKIMGKQIEQNQDEPSKAEILVDQISMLSGEELKLYFEYLLESMTKTSKNAILAINWDQLTDQEQEVLQFPQIYGSRQTDTMIIENLSEAFEETEFLSSAVHSIRNSNTIIRSRNRNRNRTRVAAASGRTRLANFITNMYSQSLLQGESNLYTEE